MSEIYDNILKSEFTTEEQQIFLQNFRCYIDYDQNKDFVIELDKIFEYLGFTQKANAKRLLLNTKYFTENEDYKIGENDILLLPKEEQKISTDINNNETLTLSGEQKKQRGGHNRQCIYLTPSAFKHLCLLANTQQGRQIRKYYVKMEEIMFDCLIKSKDAAIQNSENRIKELQLTIQKQNTFRLKKLYEYGDSVYIWMNANSEKKVGSSDNMNIRDKNYASHNRDGKMVYVKRCNNRKILEDVVHHMLRKHTIDTKRKDWFDLPVSVIQETIDAAQIFLDNFSENISILPNIRLAETMKNIFESNKGMPMPEPLQERISESTEVVVPETKSVIQALADRIREEEKTRPREIEEEPEKETLLKDMPEIPPDFERFVDECFVLEDAAVTTWIDIGARYRIWSRSTDQYKDKLNTYLIERGFNRTFFYENSTKCSLAAFKGLRMIPLDPIVLPDEPNIVHLFLYHNCVANVTGRLAIKDLRERFLEWKQKDVDKTCSKLTKKEQDDLKAHLDKAFLAATVHTGERIRFGYYGLSFKGLEHVGKKMKMGNRKVVLQIDIKTNKTVHKYDSITHAANALGVSVSSVSVAISSERDLKGYRFVIEDENNKKDT